MVETNFEMKLLGADPKKLSEDPQHLRALCQKEVDRFESYLRDVDPQFRDGLSRFEKLAIEGYIYQKTKGHLDAFHNPNPHTVEKQDG